uniref:alpha/beta fold hydrolase n=1 Tax=Thaumasiovibrio occultus TaxID=1891184 RepID=UPI000B36248D|nr:alpha/beta fold hydrolase [Thaumasiovibrio occultus]
MDYHISKTRFRSASIANNLLKDSDVLPVWLAVPTKPHQRVETVLIVLPGFGGSAQAWLDELEIAQKFCDLAGENELALPLIVIPEIHTRFTSTVYSNNSAAGDWIGMVCDDLSQLITEQLGYLPKNKWLIGHSMGGSGVLNVVMARPGWFDAAFAMSPATLEPNNGAWLRELYDEGREALTQAAQQEKPEDHLDVWRHLWVGLMQALAPNPEAPPYYCTVPTTDNEWQALTDTARQATDLLADTPTRKTKLAVDIGEKEPGFVGTVARVKTLNEQGADIALFTHSGAHTDQMATSLDYVLAWLISQ